MVRLATRESLALAVLWCELNLESGIAGVLHLIWMLPRAAACLQFSFQRRARRWKCFRGRRPRPTLTHSRERGEALCKRAMEHRVRASAARSRARKRLAVHASPQRGSAPALASHPLTTIIPSFQDGEREGFPSSEPYPPLNAHKFNILQHNPSKIWSIEKTCFFNTSLIL